jgi:hypothetical protein
MNYNEYGKFLLRVKVEIEPAWVVPTANVAEEIGREQSAARMRALGDQLADFITEALMAKQTPEEWAEVSARLRSGSDRVVEDA